MSKVIEIRVKADGSVKVETKGFSGPNCKNASGPYERALGLVSNDMRTAEYFGTTESGLQNEVQS